MKDQPSSEHQGESRLRITSVLPRRAETLVAGELRGAMPATGEQLTLTTPTGAHSVVVHDVTTLDSALEHAARSGAEILSSPSSRPLRCAFVLTGISAELLKAGDTVSFLAEGGQESQVEDRSLEATVSKAVGDPNRDTARVHLVSASAEEAERRVQSALPTSWKVWKKTVLSGGEKGNIERRAESSERALAAARQNLPPEATVLDERVEHHRSQDPVEVEAFSEDEARIKAQETSKWIDATNVRLKSRGRSRFLGIGRRPNVYEVFFREQVRAEITYQEKAIFEIIAINTAKVSDRECGAHEGDWRQCEDPAIYNVTFSQEPLADGRIQLAHKTNLCRKHARDFFVSLLTKGPPYVIVIDDLVTGESWPDFGPVEDCAKSFMEQKLAEWHYD